MTTWGEEVRALSVSNKTWGLRSYRSALVKDDEEELESENEGAERDKGRESIGISRSWFVGVCILSDLRLMIRVSRC